MEVQFKKESLPRRVAAMMAAQDGRTTASISLVPASHPFEDVELACVKCLKFLEQPGAGILEHTAPFPLSTPGGFVRSCPEVDQLAQELDLCSQVFEGLDLDM